MNIKLTAKHFGKRGTVYLGPDAIGNGHWMLRHSRVLNAAMFGTEELAANATDLHTRTVRETFAGLCGTSPVMPWTTMPWVYDHREGPVRVLTNAAGQIAGVKDAYLAMIGANGVDCVLYSAGVKSPFRDAESVDDACFLVMSFNLADVSMPCAVCAAKPEEVPS